MGSLHSVLARSVTAVAVATLLSAAQCSAATDPQGNVVTEPRGSVAQRRAQWESHGVTNYRFDYHQTGFFIPCTGPSVRVQVKGGTVDTVVELSTGKTLDPKTCWPTIDQLFDRAAAAEAVGALAAIEYDPVLGYPTRIQTAGPPDASGAYFASALQATP